MSDHPAPPPPDAAATQPQQPTASENRYSFKAGDRVRFKEQSLKVFTSAAHRGRVGRVVADKMQVPAFETVGVVWDGTSSPQYYAASHLERICGSPDSNIVSALSARAEAAEARGKRWRWRCNR